MSAPLAHNLTPYALRYLQPSPDARSAQERCFAIMGDVAPASRDDRPTRLAFATAVLGRTVESMALDAMDLETFDELADRVFGLRDSPDTVESLIAQALDALPPSRLCADPERLRELDADFEYSSEVHKKHAWADADMFSELCDLVRAGGGRPHPALTEKARILGLTVTDAERYLILSRLVRPVDRVRFGDLRWAVFLAAVQYGWMKGEIPNRPELLRRLELASNSQWNEAGLKRYLVGDKPEPNVTPISAVALDRLLSALPPHMRPTVKQAVAAEGISLRCAR